jgi:transposase
MRGRTSQQMPMFSYIPIDSWVTEKHPLRPIQEMVDRVLLELSPHFDAIYSGTGRPSIPPEQLLKALLLQVLFTIRSEAQLLEHLRFNLLYRWFVGLAPDDRIWDETVFTKNRERLLSGKISFRFFELVLDQAKEQGLISDDHFTVDGTMVHAWASFKSFQPKEELNPSSTKEEEPAPKKEKENPPPPKNDDFGSGGDASNPGVDFRGQRRTNETHQSTTDPESRLFKKSKGSEAKLAFLGHVMMENRHGLAVDTRLTDANGTAERDAAYEMALDLPGSHQKTLGADKGYDAAEHIEDIRSAGVTPHIACKSNSALDERTTRHPGYAVSQRKRKLVEEIFGWLKTVGLMRRPHLRGKKKLASWFAFSVAVYNLVRIRNLMAQEA